MIRNVGSEWFANTFCIHFSLVSLVSSHSFLSHSLVVCLDSTPLPSLSTPALSLFPLQLPSLHLLTHSQQDKLYLDGILLASNVTSVALLPDLLLYIINDVVPRLCLLPLDQLLSFSEHTITPSGVPSLAIASRALERGSLYVGFGQDGRVTVQLPRGNLETFYPRLLSCRMLEHCVFDSEDPQRWRTAVELMRRQRIRRFFGIW